MTALFKRLGLVNRYDEIQILNLMLFSAFIRAMLEPYLDDTILFAVVGVLVAFKQHFDGKLRRGLWAELTRLECQLDMWQKINADLLKDHKELSEKVSFLSNKVAFSK